MTDDPNLSESQLDDDEITSSPTERDDDLDADDVAGPRRISPRRRVAERHRPDNQNTRDLCEGGQPSNVIPQGNHAQP